MACGCKGSPAEAGPLVCDAVVSMPGRHTDHRLVPCQPWGAPAPCNLHGVLMLVSPQPLLWEKQRPARPRLVLRPHSPQMQTSGGPGSSPEAGPGCSGRKQLLPCLSKHRAQGLGGVTAGARNWRPVAQGEANTPEQRGQDWLQPHSVVPSESHALSPFCA